MDLKVYAVKDTVSGSFMQPFYLSNDEVAKRSFSIACKDEKSNYFAIAKDLQLYRVGKFNDESGELSPDCEFLMNG